MQTQCLWIQKSRILNDQGDFDEAKAEKNIKNGLGELDDPYVDAAKAEEDEVAIARQADVVVLFVGETKV